MRSSASLISALTSGSQFSFKVKAQLVCCTNRFKRPTLYDPISGSSFVIWSVTRYAPLDLEGSEIVFWNQEAIVVGVRRMVVVV